MSQMENINDTDWEVPTYEVLTLSEKKHDYCVCVFVINEGTKVQTQLKKMKALTDSIDVIVADGGSTDGSLEPDFIKDQNVSVRLTRTGPGKLSAQMRMAFDYALKRGYKGIVTIDGNNKDNTEAIPSFVSALNEGYDHIQGSRFIPGGQAINTPLSRLIGVRLLHAPLIALASGFRYTDTTNGFRAYSAKFLLDPNLKPFRNIFSQYELHYYLAIRAAKLGYKLVELPVTRRYPDSGKTPTKISPIKGNLLVLATLFKAVLGKYNPETAAEITKK